MKRKQIGLLHWITSSLVQNNNNKKVPQGFRFGLFYLLLCAQCLLSCWQMIHHYWNNSHALQLDLNEAQIRGQALNCTAKTQSDMTFGSPNELDSFLSYVFTDQDKTQTELNYLYLSNFKK